MFFGIRHFFRTLSLPVLLLLFLMFLFVLLILVPTVMFDFTTPEDRNASFVFLSKFDEVVIKMSPWFHFFRWCLFGFILWKWEKIVTFGLRRRGARRGQTEAQVNAFLSTDMSQLQFMNERKILAAIFAVYEIFIIWLPKLIL